MTPVFFQNPFNEERFKDFLQDFIPEIELASSRNEIRTGFDSIKQIGEVKNSDLDLVVFIAQPKASISARVDITKNTYAFLKTHARSNALVAYFSDEVAEWRLSLITTKVSRTSNGIKEAISNPRRFSYVLGPEAKVLTPIKMMQGNVHSIKDLENKFSLAVVSKEFYSRIATQYSKLVGGSRGEGKKAINYEGVLKLGSGDNSVYANFAIRLIGRLVFCWFLKQKKGSLNEPLIPDDLLSVNAVKKYEDYYHSICAPLFFEVLNKQTNSRPTFLKHGDFFNKVPFLNGGLFQDHPEDNHKFNRTVGISERRGVVVIPDSWFLELFGIFEEYNFTIDENTSIDTELSIDPEMLGRIFENLLAEVNPETGASARKSTGSFYTPREIVDFMVEESLIAHLKSKTNIPEEKIRTIASYDLEDDSSYATNPDEKRLLVDAIHNTSVLDPACGSGAFPIGMLQKMVHMLGILDPDCSIYLSKVPPEVRRQLQNNNLTYVRKLGVIRECIHGIDIQPIATDISRLRCFLTLVVDQLVDDNAVNRGIEPLPNLDFKFVCANTLIKPPVHEGPLFGDNFANSLGELIDEYFAPIDQIHKLETARKLQQLISNKTKEELENILKSFSSRDEKTKKMLAQKNEKANSKRISINALWGSYENIFQNKPVGFFDTRYFFPAVFRKGGFDIVIGNPPYIKEYTNKNAFNDLRESPYYQGKMDLWYMFACKSLDLLKENGIECFIAQNNWVTSSGALKMRNKIITDTQILMLIDFGDYKIFETAGIQTMIMLFQKNSNQSEYLFDLRSVISQKPIFEDVISILSKTESDDIQYLQPEIIRESILGKPLIFNKLETAEILRKIQGKANFRLDPKKEVAQGIVYPQDSLNRSNKNILGINFNVGDGIFVISNKEKEGLALTEKELELIKPSYTTKDLSKWYGNPINKEWVIYTDSSFKNIEKIDAYPNIKNHLDKFKKIITTDNKPYGLHRSRDEYFFRDEKIIVARKCISPTFTYTDFDSYVSATFYIIKTKRVNQKYLTGILNSKLIAFWLKNKGKMQGNNYQIDKEPILEIPILIASEAQQKEIISLVDKIITFKKLNSETNIKDIEISIDELIMNLYQFTEKEKDLIRNNMK